MHWNEGFWFNRLRDFLVLIGTCQYLFCIIQIWKAQFYPLSSRIVISVLMAIFALGGLSGATYPYRCSLNEHRNNVLEALE